MLARQRRNLNYTRGTTPARVSLRKIRTPRCFPLRAPLMLRSALGERWFVHTTHASDGAEMYAAAAIPSTRHEA